MKTSILISSLAAFCLMLTFAEVPSKQRTETSSSSLIENISYLPASYMGDQPSVTEVSETTKKADIATTKTTNEDFSFLKFNVAQYINDENTDAIENNEPEVKSESDFTNLKFDVTKYSEKDDNFLLPTATKTESFDYLKFDVNKFMSSASSDEINELPADDFSYLKFDSTKYIQLSNNYDTDELPAN